MSEKRPILHSLSRIAERPNILDWHTVQLMVDNPVCEQLAAPLFSANLYSAAITQRHHYDSDEYIAEHRYGFTIVLRGEMKMKIGDQEYLLSPGDIAFSPPGYNFRRWHESPAWWVYFEFLEHKFWRDLKKIGPYCRQHESPDLIFILLQQLMDLRYGCDDILDPAGKSAFLSASTPRALEYSRMLLNILRQESVMARDSDDSQIGRLHALVQQIRLSPHQDWNVDNMSQYLRTSVRTLRRLTTHEYNQSPLHLVIQARLDEAVRWLRNPENSVEAIAYHVGYESVFSFSRLFSKYMGMAPGRYRKKLLADRGNVLDEH